MISLKNKIRFINHSTNIISTLVGDGYYRLSGDFGLATSASLANPADIWIDSSSNLYIADSKNHRIRKVSLITNLIVTVAGIGSAPSFGSFSGDGGQATSANLNTPH
jgi:DNA-binding beta-propeller fold protein YncE